MKEVRVSAENLTAVIHMPADFDPADGDDPRQDEARDKAVAALKDELDDGGLDIEFDAD